MFLDKSIKSSKMNFTWSHGSVGRAPRSHRGGHRFESYCDHHKQDLSIKRDFFIIHIEGGKHSPPPAVVISQFHRWNVPFSSSYSSLSVSTKVAVSVGRVPLPLVEKLEKS